MANTETNVMTNAETMTTAMYIKPVCTSMSPADVPLDLSTKKYE